MEVAQEVFFGYATNISSRGIYIQTINPKPTGFKVRLRFNLPGDRETIECSGEVVWSKEYDSKTCRKPGMGLKFLDLSQQHADRIEAFVERKIYAQDFGSQEENTIS
jgi:uncharacterized protein (TIGR02266 family)